MSEPIKVGDLVMQIRACCSAIDTIGMVGVVTFVHQFETLCLACSQRNKGVHVSCSGRYGGVPISWVKRIDPLPESVDTRHDEEITA